MEQNIEIDSTLKLEEISKLIIAQHAIAGFETSSPLLEKFQISEMQLLSRTFSFSSNSIYSIISINSL